LATPFERTRAGPPPAIVVVDDYEDDLFLFKRLLASAAIPHKLLAFTDGAEAIKYFERVASGGVERPCACFLDINMPGYGGFDVLSAMRSNHAHDRLPVIMLSSSDEPRDIAAAARKQAQCYLVKYPPAAELISVLKQAEEFARAKPKHPTVFPTRFNLLAH
jgi:two-component system, chemotaxis family, response regulator Rcp1